MRLSSSSHLLGVLSLLASAANASIPSSGTSATSARSQWVRACETIHRSLSPKSDLYYPGTAGYARANEHWAPNAAENSTCAVEPGSSQDVSTIIRVLGKTSTPFGIKSGGHSSSKGASSTQGVQISLRRLNQVTFKKENMVADLGPGGLWIDVFNELDKHSVSAPGGRIASVGVGGYLLGGGYSWEANKRGLAFDNIVAYELVKPNGDIVQVSKDQNPDLFFGLKGGYNNFGIVTRFTIKVLEQGSIYGGFINYDEKYFEPVFAAFVNHSNHNTDPECTAVLTLTHNDTAPFASMSLYYNAPEQRNGCFDSFLALPYFVKNITRQPLADYIHLIGDPLLNPTHKQALIQAPQFGIISLPVVRAFAAKVKEYGLTKPFGSGVVFSAIVEAYIHSSLIRSNLHDSAWPHQKFLSPSGFLIFWDKPSDDDKAHRAIVDAADTVTRTASSDEDVKVLHPYPNYLLEGTVSLGTIYGANLPALEQLAKKHDPHGVMTLSGGFKFQKSRHQ